MKINTVAFGDIEYEEEELLVFNDGIYGFPDLKSFIFIESQDENFHFNWLQSIEDKETTFVVTSPFLFVENYDFEIADSVVEKLGIKDIKDLTVFSVVKIPADVSKTTLNLKAPIIINNESRRAKQIILDEEFDYSYYIFDKDLNERK